jgi:phage gp36-like protein
LSDAKARLQIEEADVSFDSELADVIIEAQAIMDADLNKHVDTPLTSVPDLLKYACADLAASLFRSRRVKPEEQKEDLATSFRDAYQTKIAVYVKNVLHKETLTCAGLSQFENEVIAQHPDES